MIPAEPLPDESERLQELLNYQILDTPEEEDFNNLVDLAAQICGAEIALISLIDDHRQWFKAKHGLDVDETPKKLAFCAHAIHGDEIMEVENATEDERFHDNPIVVGPPHIRFYAGQPLCSANGYKFGTLCVIDRHPRHLTEVQRQALRVLAHQVERQLELRLRQRQLEESLAVIEAQKQRLEALNRIKDQTLAVLSHDLRSPLAALETVLELFQDGLDAEEVTELVQEIRPELMLMVKHLNHVLTWAGEQMQGTLAQLEPCGVMEIAEESLEWVDQAANQKGVELAVDVDPEVRVIGDRELITVVLRNLLSNGVKFCRKGDRITVFSQDCGQRLKLGVRDTGLGMLAVDVDKILCPTTHFSKQGTAQEKGMGLGLLLCQNYLETMETRLEIKSQLAQGSEFAFHLYKAPVVVR